MKIFHPSLESLWCFFATMLSAVASVGLLSSVISIGVRYLGDGVSGLKSATPLEWAAMLLGGMVFPSW